jgi:hypothetical protein
MPETNTNFGEKEGVEVVVVVVGGWPFLFWVGNCGGLVVEGEREEEREGEGVGCRGEGGAGEDGDDVGRLFFLPIMKKLSTCEHV